MRKLIAGACILALAATASPALAGGGQGGGGNGRSHQSTAYIGGFGNVDRLMKAFWAQRFGSGFGSHGNHFGWFRGKHWGWFKPHHPNWPHHPPKSP